MLYIARGTQNDRGINALPMAKSIVTIYRTKTQINKPKLTLEGLLINQWSFSIIQNWRINCKVRQTWILTSNVSFPITLVLNALLQCVPQFQNGKLIIHELILREIILIIISLFFKACERKNGDICEWDRSMLQVCFK